MNELAATTPIVRQRGNQLFTTSIDVAEKFGKQHKNVLQAILALECSDEFNRLNFQPVKYVDEKGERRPMYHISRDGFSFLAMGFRGKKACVSSFSTKISINWPRSVLNLLLLPFLDQTSLPYRRPCLAGSTHNQWRLRHDPHGFYPRHGCNEQAAGAA